MTAATFADLEAANERIGALEEKVDALKASVEALLAIAGIEVAPEDPQRAAFDRFRERAADPAGVLRR